MNYQTLPRQSGLRGTAVYVSGDGVDYGYELPDPPDNLEFLELFTPEEQDAIDARFQRGIVLGQAREIAAATALRQTQRSRRARQAPEPVIQSRR